MKQDNRDSIVDAIDVVGAKIVAAADKVDQIYAGCQGGYRWLAFGWSSRKHAQSRLLRPWSGGMYRVDRKRKNRVKVTGNDNST